MMTRRLAVLLAASAGILLTASAGWAQQSEITQQLGIGAHYWKTVKDIDINAIDEDGFSYVAMYQLRYGWVGLEADIEWFKNGFGGSTEDVFQPQAYVIVGKVIYAAAGIGGYYSNNKLSDKVFYAFRAGLDIPVLPILHLDVNANYRFENWDDLSTEGKEIDTDTVTLGAALRLAF